MPFLCITLGARFYTKVQQCSVPSRLTEIPFNLQNESEQLSDYDKPFITVGPIKICHITVTSMGWTDSTITDKICVKRLKNIHTNTVHKEIKPTKDWYKVCFLLCHDGMEGVLDRYILAMKHMQSKINKGHIKRTKFFFRSYSFIHYYHSHSFCCFFLFLPFLNATWDVMPTTYWWVYWRVTVFIPCSYYCIIRNAKIHAKFSSFQTQIKLKNR